MLDSTKQLLVRYEDYLERHVKSNGDELMPSTVERYTQLMEYFARSHEPLKKDEPRILVEELNAFIKQTRNSVLLSAARHLLEYFGVDKKIVKELKPPKRRANAASSVRFLQKKVLTKKEIATLFEEVPDPQFELALRVLYDTAARRKEMNDIRWRDVEFTSDTIREEKGIYARVLLKTKGGKQREAYLKRDTVKLIYRLHEESRYKKMDYLVRYQTKRGKLVSNREHYLYRYLREYSLQFLGRKVTPHFFRHSAATHYADAGADALDIMALLGHEEISTSQIYLDISTFRAERAFTKYA